MGSYPRQHVTGRQLSQWRSMPADGLVAASIVHTLVDEFYAERQGARAVADDRAALALRGNEWKQRAETAEAESEELLQTICERNGEIEVLADAAAAAEARLDAVLALLDAEEAQHECDFPYSHTRHDLHVATFRVRAAATGEGNR